MKIELENIAVQIGENSILHGIDLRIDEGELFTLIGPSGSGKTTVLRVLAGLIPTKSGTVRIGGEDVTTTPSHRRGLGMVFQRLALFPHLTVGDNIAFPLVMRGMGKAEQEEVVRRSLDMVRLDSDFANRNISDISGGQQQRVAIARSLVYQPGLLLLDEPFAALDANLRIAMQDEVIRLHRELGVTVINVTHDQDEAFRVSSRIAVMENGKIAQVGAPSRVYRQPDSLFVAEFLGPFMSIEGETNGAGTEITTANERSYRVPKSTPSSPAVLVVRPDVIRVQRRDVDIADNENRITATVTDISLDRNGQILECNIENGGEISVYQRVSASDGIVPGSPVHLVWPWKEGFCVVQ